MLGFLNPKQRPDVNLLPTNDDRYHFYEFPVRRWTGSVEDREFSLHGPAGFG